MEGHGPNVFRPLPQHGGEALLQLSGSLVGKGDGNNIPGICRLQGTQPVCTVQLLLGGLGGQVFQKIYILILDLSRDLPAVRSPAIAQDVGNSVDEHGGLAAPGTGQQQQGTFRGQYGFPLHIVQKRKTGSNIVSAGGQKSGIQFIIHRSTYHFFLRNLKFDRPVPFLQRSPHS